MGDEGVDFRHGDDVAHESAQPLRLQEVELAELALHVVVVQQDATLVEEVDCLGRGGGGRSELARQGRRGIREGGVSWLGRGGGG